MQISEMPTFYNLHYHKRVLRLIINSNLFSSPNVSLSKSAKIRSLSPQYHSLGRRYIHSSNRLSSNVPDDENPRVWASFDPVTNDVTTSVVGGSEGLRCESDSGDEKVGALSGLGSFVEGKESEEEESERVPQSWATVYRKRSGGAGCNTDSTTRAVGGSQSLRSESDSGDEKFEASSGLGSFREGSIQERGSGADEKFEASSGLGSFREGSIQERGSGADEKFEASSGLGSFREASIQERGSGADEKIEDDESGMTPKSWSSAYSKGSGGTEAITTTAGETESLRYESDSGNGKLGNLLGIGSFVESSVPDKGGSVVKKKSDKELSGGRGGDRASPKSGDHLSMGMSVSKNKKGKTKTYWVCSGCGKEFGKWWGSCTSCGEELKEFLEPENVDGKTTGYSVTDKVVGSWFHQKAGELFPQRVTDVNKGINQLTWKIPLSGLFGAEVGRVLGGGLVPGCLVLVGGDPGVGKSTLLLQIAAMIAEGDGSGRPAPVVYVSGEESVEQIANRADRMRIGTEDLFLYSGTDIEDILEKIHALSPRALIVDSIQTVYLKGVAGSAGGMVQVKECTQSLLRFAKKTNIPVLLIGHVTKAGDLAGPRVLEHIVDVVLYMEGEKYSAHRFLRSVKNRFGSTDELGVFEMSQDGLQAVPNPSDIFLSEQHSDSEILVGLAVAVIIDGSRSFLLEIQALCLPDTLVPRQFNGVQKKRSEMIISVLTKQAGLMLQNNAIFVNVVSGVNVQETAGDLAIAAAICSSFLEFPIPNDIAFIGEIGLAGELRPVPRMEKRVNAVAKLGYRKCIVPKSAEKQLATLDSSGMIILGCKNLKEVINNVFQS